MDFLYKNVLYPHILNAVDNSEVISNQTSDADVAAKINKSILNVYGEFLSEDGNSIQIQNYIEK